MMKARTKMPGPVIGVAALAIIGILFWLSMTVQAFAAADTNRWFVLALAVILGGAHVAALVWTLTLSRKAHWALWTIILGDSLLTLLVNWQAALLVGFTIVMLLLTRTHGAKTWYTRP